VLSSALGKLGREIATEPQQIAFAAQLEQASSGGSGDELLKLSFKDWCATCQVKTDKGLQPFALFESQMQFADLIVGPRPLSRRTISLLSSRQTGKTSLMLAIMSYLAQSRRQFTGLIIHKTLEDSRLLCRRLKASFLGENVEMVTDSLSLLHFKASGSQIIFRSSNPGKADGAQGAGRGLNAIDCVFCDESSHTNNLMEVLNVVRPTTQWSNLGIVVFAGTGSSKQSYFYDCLSRAAGSSDELEKTLEAVRTGTVEPCQILDPGAGNGKGNVACITHWRSVPMFQDEPDFLQRVSNESDLSEAMIASEYQLDFSSSIDSAAFDFSLVIQAQVDSLEYTFDEDDEIYVGVDPSGQGKDFAVAIAVLKTIEKDKPIYTVIQAYRKRTGVSEQHLSSIADMIKKLRPHCTVVEKNSMGQVWVENLAGMRLRSPIEGFATTASSKPVLIGRLQIALERGSLRIPKGPIIDELLAYRRTDDGKLQAGGNAHDDCVIALALALHAAGIDQSDRPFTRATIPSISGDDAIAWMSR
jgi:hypothetical protein